MAIALSDELQERVGPCTNPALRAVRGRPVAGRWSSCKLSRERMCPVGPWKADSGARWIAGSNRLRDAATPTPHQRQTNSNPSSRPCPPRTTAARVTPQPAAAPNASSQVETQKELPAYYYPVSSSYCASALPFVPRTGAKVLVAIVYSNNELWSDDAPYKNISYLCCKY